MTTTMVMLLHQAEMYSFLPIITPSSSLFLHLPLTYKISCLSPW